MKTIKTVRKNGHTKSKEGRAKVLSSVIDDLVYENKLLFNVADRLKRVIDEKLGATFIQENEELSNFLHDAGKELIERQKKRSYDIQPLRNL